MALADLEQRVALGAARDSEARFRAAFELNPAPAWLADAAGRVTAVSGRWRALTGLADAASLGSGWVAAVHGEDAPRTGAAWEQAVAAGADLDVEYRLRTADGALRWVRARARPQRDAEGRVVGWHGWTEDVQDRVRAERERATLLLAARGAADGLWGWELTTGEFFHSPRLGELLGYPPGELPQAGDLFGALAHPDDLPRYREAVEAQAERRAPLDVELRLGHRDGGWRWFRLRGQAEWDAAGRPLRVAGSAGDVSEQRTTEAALRESQTHLALLFSRAAVGLSELAPDGRFLRVNAELCRIVGRTPDEMTAVTFADVTHPDDVVRSVTAVSSVFAAGGSVRLEKRYLRPDGTAVVAESVVSLLEPEAGGEPSLLAVTTDLTAWRAAEAALRESEARFRQLADNVSEMFWLVELGPTLMDSRVIYVNPAYTRITGRPLASVDDTPVLAFDLIAPDDLPRALAALDAATLGEPGTVEYRLTTPAEAPAVVRTRVFPIRDGEGRVVRLGGLTEDVTEQRTLEERLRQAHKMEAVGRLAGGVAHDFNNLLTVISANLEFAQEALAAELPSDHPVGDDLAGIAHATVRARTLVRQLLAFSRRQPVQPRPVRLGALVRGAEPLLRRTLGEEITLAVDVAADAPTVHADPGQLEQVLLNLAANGRDAMLTPRHGHPGAGGTLTVAVDVVPPPADAPEAPRRARSRPRSSRRPARRCRAPRRGRGRSPPPRPWS